MVPRQLIREAIDEYVRFFPEDTNKLGDLKEILNRGVDPLSRMTFSGHVTCSSVVLCSPSTVILIKHRILNRWLLPGGHVESTDESLRMAALREACEEIGLERSNIRDLIVGHRECPIDIDRHTIPSNPRKGEPEHEHWDFRFPFAIGAPQQLTLSDELIGAQEVPITELSPPIRDRLERLFGGDI
jgi:8-oxo-dGTP pyrophosphatase MutT (NUDIX family)